MCRRHLVFLVSGILFIGGAYRACAQTPLPTQEAVRSFDATITVNTDNSVDVREIITYETGPAAHHGIYRDIYPYSSQDRKMEINSVVVTDGLGDPFPFTTSNTGGYVRLKIGDPNQTFTGERTYIISYHATRAVGQFDTFDEIYWNVTGNEWNIPIYNITASILLPTGVTAIQSSCYYGPKGATTQCSTQNVNGVYESITPPVLVPGEGVTIAVGFPKGVAIPYTTIDNLSRIWHRFGTWIVAGLIPLIVLILSLLYWYRYGRDPKGTGVIVPQYDVPDGLTPMEVAGIVSENVSPKNIPAEIIYLATRGYLKISELPEKKFGLFTHTDYQLTQLQEGDDLPIGSSRLLLKSLFRSNGSDPLPRKMKLSFLKDSFYKDAAEVIESVLNALETKGYYRFLGRMKAKYRNVATILRLAVFSSLFVAYAAAGLTQRLSGETILLFLASGVVSAAIFLLVSHFDPAKTVKGVAAKEYLLGLKLYLQIAEKRRIEFHNAPERSPEVFEKLLPYAMVLGVSDIWAKEFSDIDTVPPSWYEGETVGQFNTVSFANSLHTFNTSATSSLGTAPGGGGGLGGSGGGGSSGGGGGGGGGGSW